MATILFWGPLGKQGETTIGGGESGNRRTIKMLSKKGIKVITVRKPYPPKYKLVSPIIYGLLLSLSVIKFSYYCFKNKSQIDIAHISGFYSHLVYFELAMMIVARFNHIPFIYEIRGGAMLRVYQKRSWLYRFAFNSILRYSDAVFSQGVKYLDFIKEKTSREPVFYPNYVDAKELNYTMNSCRVRAEKVELIYFGRIVPEKGIKKIIETCRCLSNAGFNHHLHIVGSGPSDFVTELKSLTENLNVCEYVTFYTPMSFSELKKKLLHMHFFIFPTVTEMEGHSNALTESMAFGVVPICSDQGFNEHVVGPCGKILCIDAEASTYAQVIQDLWKEGMWKKLSTQCRERVSSLFSSDIVIPCIIRKYNELSKAKHSGIGVSQGD